MLDLPLRCKIEGNELVFRIGLGTLAWAAERVPEMYDDQIRPEPPYVQIENRMELAHDVVAAMNSEEEDGSTPVIRMIDKAIMDAWENGSIGFADERTHVNDQEENTSGPPQDDPATQEAG
jgi:hypothetical protein